MIFLIFFSTLDMWLWLYQKITCHTSFEYSYFIVIVVNLGWTKSALNKENTNLSELKKECEIYLTMLLWLGQKKKKKKRWLAFSNRPRI